MRYIKPKFHYADFHRNFPSGKVVDTNHESRRHKHLDTWSAVGLMSISSDFLFVMCLTLRRSALTSCAGVCESNSFQRFADSICCLSSFCCCISFRYGDSGHGGSSHSGSVEDKKTQLSLGWGRLYWLSLTLKVIQGQWFFLFYLKERMPLPIRD